MRLKTLFGSVSDTLYIAVFLVVAVVGLYWAYSFHTATGALEKRIELRQAQLGRIITLKNAYLARQRQVEEAGARAREKKKLSLGLMEETISKVFKSGRLGSLKPSTLKEERGQSFQVVEVKIVGAVLAEVIEFCREIDASGFRMRRLQLALPQNQILVDVTAAISER